MLEEVKAWWSFFKDFTADVGGRLHAAVLLAFGFLIFSAWKNPDTAIRVFTTIFSYIFGMFFHPIIIKGYIIEQEKNREEIRGLKAEVESLRSTLVDVMSILVKNGHSSDIAEEVLSALKKHENN